MKMIKINMEHESMDSESEINELMELCSSFNSYKEVDGEIIQLESVTDLLDAYEFETDIFYFEVSNVENLGLEYLQIEKVDQGKILKGSEQMTNINIDDFKTYEGYEGMYIVESYIRTKYADTVLFASVDDMEAMDFMDENECWDECTLYYIDDKGNATYPNF